jgi:hypothetical protein
MDDVTQYPTLTRADLDHHIQTQNARIRALALRFLKEMKALVDERYVLDRVAMLTTQAGLFAACQVDYFDRFDKEIFTIKDVRVLRGARQAKTEEDLEDLVRITWQLETPTSPMSPVTGILVGHNGSSYYYATTPKDYPGFIITAVEGKLMWNFLVTYEQAKQSEERRDKHNNIEDTHHHMAYRAMRMLLS